MKGYIFSMDAALGTLLSILILWSILWQLRLPDVMPEVQAMRTAQDVLDVLMENGTIKTHDAGQISGAMESLLPANVAYRLEIDTYEYASGFVQIGSLEIGSHVPSNETDPDTDVPLPLKTERTFVTMDGSDIETYNNVVMWVWFR